MIWEAFERGSSVAELRVRFPSVDCVLERFVKLGVCEVPHGQFPPDRRRVVVVEPHMDDAALSVGGAMWLRRKECEFHVVTMAGITDFTGYHLPDRLSLDIAQVTALRRAESTLYVRHLGGRHTALDLLEAPLRYLHGQPTFDDLCQFAFRAPAFGHRATAECPLEHWTSALRRALGSLDPEEVWVPLGVGPQVDHHLARDACLQALLVEPQFARPPRVLLYEDVPYSGAWPRHASQIIDVLRKEGARIEENRVNISAVVEKKERLVSIFSSQFSAETLRAHIRRCAGQGGLQASQFEEVMYKLVAPPSGGLEELGMRAEEEPARILAQRMVPWLKRHRLTPVLRVVLHIPVSAWADWKLCSGLDLLLRLFPKAQLEVLLDRSWLPEARPLVSPRIRLRVIESERWSWYQAALRLFFTRPRPLLVVGNSSRPQWGHLLKAGSWASQVLVVPGTVELMLAMQMLSERE